MTFTQMLIIAIVQAISEFLPISSSGHLILIPKLTDLPDQGPMIDIAVHVGTLLAIITYFFKDAWGLVRGGGATIGLFKKDSDRNTQKTLFLWIVIATIPAVFVGAIFKFGGYLENFRSTDLVAINLIFYGILLGLADYFGKQVKKYEDLTLKDAIIVGFAQALALIPGTSRSGVTMTAARFLGYSRTEAARFSFLLSMPAVAGAGLLITRDLANADTTLLYAALLTGFITFVAALLVMAFLMRFLRKASMLIFVIYRIAMGIALLALF